jgi:hypothetical protein
MGPSSPELVPALCADRVAGFMPSAPRQITWDDLVGQAFGCGESVTPLCLMDQLELFVDVAFDSRRARHRGIHCCPSRRPSSNERTAAEKLKTKRVRFDVDTHPRARAMRSQSRSAAKFETLLSAFARRQDHPSPWFICYRLEFSGKVRSPCSSSCHGLRSPAYISPAGRRLISIVYVKSIKPLRDEGWRSTPVRVHRPNDGDRESTKDRLHRRWGPLRHSTSIFTRWQASDVEAYLTLDGRVRPLSAGRARPPTTTSRRKAICCARRRETLTDAGLNRTSVNIRGVNRQSHADRCCTAPELPRVTCWSSE